MYLKERLRRLGQNIERKLLGPSIEDRDFPDPRPDNPARDRLEAAKTVAEIETKEDALSQITNAIAGEWSDYEFRSSYHGQVGTLVSIRAIELGASKEEIGEAVREGNMSGAMLRAGHRDYWR